MPSGTVWAKRPRLDARRIDRTARVSLGRPISGCAASRFVAVMPGWDTLLVNPQSRVRLHRSNSRAKSMIASFDWP